MAENIIPIFIFGAAHSGTTILHRMLAMHPDVIWFSQFSQRGGGIPGRSRIPCHHQLDRILRYSFAHDWRKKEWWLRHLLVPHPGEANRIWEHMIPEDDAISPDESIKRIRLIIDEECRLWGRVFIITKLPRLYRHTATLETAYPEAKFAHMIRDGRAVALSNRGKFMRNQESAMEGLRASARFWAKVMDEVDLQKRKVDIFEVKYEEFCTHVHGNIRKFLIHVGLDEEQFPFYKCSAKLEITNAGWFEQATEEELAMVEEAQEDCLRRYGYLTQLT